MKKLSVSSKFFITIIISLCLGAVAGIGTVMFADGLSSSVKNLYIFVSQNLLALNLGFVAIFAILSLTFHFRARGFLKKISVDDDILAQKSEQAVDFSMLFSLLIMISEFFFFSAAIALIDLTGFKVTLISLVVLVFVLIFCTFLDVQNVKLIRRTNPRMKANPLDLKFDKKWEQESDEAEKSIMYKAAFRSFMLLKYVFIGSWVVLVLLSMITPIGILPAFMISLFWGVHSISFCLYSRKIKS